MWQGIGESCCVSMLEKMPSPLVEVIMNIRTLASLVGFL
jgi:hypothetical protein